MTSEKKLELKRLIIYLFLSFAPIYISVPILNKAMGGLIFDGELMLSPVTSLVSFLIMMCPAVASILTRIITKEGLKDSYLRANFKGNMKYYALAIIIPVIYSFVGAVLSRIAYGASESNDITAERGTSIVLLQISTAIIMSFYAFGEELGWRGYMMPKLEKLIGAPSSIFVGGIIWGLWHAPLICSGHSFGTKYKGFPFTGIGLMCVSCILIGCILTYITKRTKSIYPASILHMVNNNIVSVFTMLFVSYKALKNINSFLLMLIPIFVISVVTYILIIKDCKKQTIHLISQKKQTI